jgi:hypothetical protein
MTSLEKEFVPYQESLELKELGFDEPCFGFYERNKELVIQECEITDFHFDSLQCVAPTLSQAFRFFRNKYNLCGWVQESYFKGLKLHQYHIGRFEALNIISDLSESEYEQVELDCLRKLIEIVKKIINK